MTELERMQIKGALRKCAKENEGKTTYTGHVVISSVCNAAADRIEELEKQIEKMKCDVKANIKWADENKNNQMYCKLNAMINQWEIKEK